MPLSTNPLPKAGWSHYAAGEKDEWSQRGETPGQIPLKSSSGFGSFRAPGLISPKARRCWVMFGWVVFYEVYKAGRLKG